MDKMINNSNPDEMLKASKKITAYAENLKKDMKKLLQTHQGMHSYWSGRQYDDFTRVIEETDREIQVQADKLLQIASDVESDARQLKIALAQNLG